MPMEGGSHEPMEEMHESHHEEPVSHEPPKKPSGTVIIAAVIIVLAIILANAIRSEDDAARLTTDEGLTIELGESRVIDGDGSEVMEESKLETSFMHIRDFEEAERAERIINTSQGKNPGTQGSEEIVYGIVRDESNDDIVYFATSSVNPDKANFVGVYKYEIESGRWHRLSKSILNANQDGTLPMWRIVGKMGSKLILLQDLVGNRLGLCDSLWLLPEKGPYGLYSLDLENPGDGLKQYDISSDLRDQELEKEANCEAGV